MNDIDINLDSFHLVQIAGLYFGYKLIILGAIIVGFVALFFLVRYFIRAGAGIQLPQAPNVRDGDNL